MSETAILLFAHGARDPDWARPFQLILRQLQSARPQAQVALAFQDFMQPTLGEAAAQLVAKGAKRAVLVPLFMAQGGHLKQDLPRLVATLREQHPQLELRVMDAIGDSPEILQAISDWVLRGTAA